jgi:hypothetical protein
MSTLTLYAMVLGLYAMFFILLPIPTLLVTVGIAILLAVIFAFDMVCKILASIIVFAFSIIWGGVALVFNK